MAELGQELAPHERIILAVDTSNQGEAEDLARLARDAGARFVKLGLELSTATSWSYCSELSAEYGLDWVADAKLDDIPNTVARAVDNISHLEHPPVGITIHTKSGTKSLIAAQAEAEKSGILLLGVTHLTSNDEKETAMYEKATPRRVVWREARRAVAGNIGGLVCSGEEVGMVKRFKKTKGLFTMIPGTRSLGANTHDQKRIVTPGEAIAEGADLLVIGRQITTAENPVQAYQDIVAEIEAGLYD